jgi:hypothetical protein
MAAVAPRRPARSLGSFIPHVSHGANHVVRPEPHRLGRCGVAQLAWVGDGWRGREGGGLTLLAC